MRADQSVSRLRKLRQRLTSQQTSEAAPIAGFQGLDEHAWRQFDRLTLLPTRPVEGGLGGEHRSRRRAPSSEYVDHRAYQPGDDLRRVDWNVYGRLGSLHVKVTEAMERLHVTVVLDCSASMRWGEPDKFDHARGLTAALATIALKRTDIFRIVCLSDRVQTFGPVSGRQRFPEVLRFLRETDTGGETQLRDDSIQLVLGRQRANAAQTEFVIVISDLLVSPPNGVEHALDRLRRQGANVVLLHLLSPQEEDPGVQGDLELIDAETGASLEVGLGPAERDLYRQRFHRWRSGIEQTCHQRGARYVYCRTDQPVETLVLSDLRRAGILG